MRPNKKVQSEKELGLFYMYRGEKVLKKVVISEHYKYYYA